MKNDNDFSAPLPLVQSLVLGEMPPADEANDGKPVVAGANPLHQLKARLQVCVGEVSLTVGELLAAKENQVLRLDSTLDQPVDLLLEGKVVARGQLVAVDDHFAVRITELPVNLQV